MEIASAERVALDAALSRLNLEIEEHKKEMLLGHLHLVMEKNKVLNLTRIDSMEQAIILHLEDSLSVLEEFLKDAGAFCDIGTGGGFPGLPLGIVSDRHGVLLDSVKKKAHAVQEFIDMLGLSEQLACNGVRSEEYALEHMHSFSTVIARAVSSLNVVIELAAPLLSLGGHLIAMRGTESKTELQMAFNAAGKCGMTCMSSRTFEIGSAESTYSRSVYVFEKVEEEQVKLPRRPGMATKRPLK